jgi:hypothetical protein
MCKNQFYMLLILMVFNLSVSAQTSTGTLHPDISFLNINDKVFSFWYGSMSNHILRFAYENHLHGWARINFYPKTLKDKKSIDFLYKANHYKDEVIRNYALNNLVKFNIWAVFVDKAYDKDKEDAGDITIYTPNYPCAATLYKRVKNGWAFVKSAQINKSGDEFKLFPSVSY